jgi:hypothetical protein
MGFWTVLPYSTVRSFPPLRLAPSGVVPQRERRPRPIMDYSFYHTNQASAPIDPTHAMQFGRTLKRLLQRIVYCNPRHGPPLLAKIDLADGYYRIPLSPSAALWLAVVIPSDDPHLSLVGIPLTLPMGWSQSPPYFCAFTETVTDIANNSPLPSSHPVYRTTQQPALPQQSTFHRDAVILGSESAPPLAYHDVYIDATASISVIFPTPCHRQRL